jgi:hypothetical protein
MGVMVQSQIRANAGRSWTGFQGERAMSNPAELLALLSIHGINLNHVPGGIPSLVALDVAGGLGMIHDHAAAAMLLAKYSMDAHATRTYRDHWRMMVDRRAYTEGWKDDGRLVAFANYSFEELQRRREQHDRNRAEGLPGM